MADRNRPNRGLRIGILANSMLQSEGFYAGGNVHTLEVAERWSDAGNEVVFFAPPFAEGMLRRRFPHLRVVVMPDLPARFGGRVVRFLFRAAAACTRRHELSACDALFASSPFLPDTVPLLVARRPARTIFLAHVLAAPWRRPGSLFWNSLASINELLGLLTTRIAADTLVTCSELVARQLLRRGLHQRCFVTTNGVEHVEHRSDGIRSGAVCVARLHHAKGAEDLIHIWRLVADSLPDAVVHMVGDGEPAFRAHLVDLVASLGLERNVSLEGSVDAATRDRLLGQAAVFVFPSHEEGWGIAVAEALAAGLPCVTYDLPVFREVFPHGRLAVSVGDRAGFAHEVIALLRDPAQRDELAALGRESVRKYTWARAAEIDARAIAVAREKKFEAKSAA